MYNALVVEHFSKTDHVGEIEDKDLELKIGNPVCGDTIHVHIKCDDKRHITDAKFKAYGCATSIATASIFTEYILNKTCAEVASTAADYRKHMLGDLEPSQMHCYEILNELFTQVEQVVKES